MHNAHRGSTGSAISGLLILTVVAGAVIFALSQCNGGVIVWFGKDKSPAQQYGQALSQSKEKGDRTAIALRLRSVGQAVVAAHLSNSEPIVEDPEAFAAEMVDQGAVTRADLANWPAPTPHDPPFLYNPDSAGAMGGRTIVVYEHPQNFDGLGGHVVYADGSVHWLDNPAFEEAIGGLRP